MKPGEKFLLGVNYWPGEKAMKWWQEYEPAEVRRDFAAVRDLGLRLVRFFLLWEDFQPRPDVVSRDAFRALADVMDAAAENDLEAMPTFFTGHMSGVNWLPEWTLASGGPDDIPYRTVSGGEVVDAVCGEIYTDAKLLTAQEFLVHKVSEAVADHPALWGWDFFNEHSNIRSPVKREIAREWCRRMRRALSGRSRERPVTFGIHQKDLETPTGFRPADVAPHSDLLSAHPYPFYAKWSRGGLDAGFAPFVVSLTRALSQSALPVLAAELGVPTHGEGEEASAGGRELFDEMEAGRYFEAVLPALAAAGAVGMLAWCFSDYAPELRGEPPFDEAPHELHFGIFHADGSVKPTGEALRRFATARPEISSPPPPVGLDVERFYGDPKATLGELYARYAST